jgi:DUF2911 family protein
MRTIATALLLMASIPAFAQAVIPLPEASPAATVSQTIGVTDVTVSYHRPAVNNRKIWGGQVPYGEVWRAGANENTTISFSTPVKIEGQPLAAGTYGLHMIPTPSQFTVIFSKFANGWGSYMYDPSEDALRVTVTPQTVSDSQERLTYTFDDVTNNSATAALRWEKLRVPFKIAVDLPSTVQASIDESLRGGRHWDAEAWASAARWELRNGNIDKAAQYADRSLDMGTTFGGLLTKAAVLDKQGDKTGAAALRDRAKAMANEAQLISYTVNPMKPAEAIAYLSGYLTAHPMTPEAWRINAMLGAKYAESGDRAKAHDAFAKALAAAHTQADRMEVYDYINGVAATGKYD